MPIRSLVLSAILCGSAIAAAAQPLSAPAPRPAIAAPRYVGPMGSNPNPSAFAAPALSPKTITVVPLANVGKIMTPRSRNSTCYAIHSYTITPESDTIGITRPTSESTCVAADHYTMKQAVQPATGPEFR